jgi:hypothetical protein
VVGPASYKKWKALRKGDVEMITISIYIFWINLPPHPRILVRFQGKLPSEQ